jgi:uncharacterized membrane protein YgdD (TMEM256/DUF423 family)
MMTVRALIGSGAISAFLAVLAGAFGAHALKSRLTPDLLAVFEVGARYHMYHALGLFVAAWLADRWQGGQPGWAGVCFVVGTVLFSGSLYAMALTGHRWLGAITPVGGGAFLTGWLLLVWAAAARS